MCPLYLIWILHQTTTRRSLPMNIDSCILFGFYIKPQRRALYSLIMRKLHHYYSAKNQSLHSEEVVFDAIFQSNRFSKNKYN